MDKDARPASPTLRLPEEQTATTLPLTPEEREFFRTLIRQELKKWRQQ